MQENEHNTDAAQTPLSEEGLPQVAALRSLTEAVTGKGNVTSVTDAALRALFESIGDGVILLDAAGKVVFVNHTAQELLGFPENELLGKDWVDAVQLSEDDKGGEVAREQRPTQLASLMRAPIPFIGYYKRKNENRLPVSLTASPILMGDRSVGMIEVFRDITQDMERSRDLQKFQLALDNASDHIVITDTDGRIIYANPAVKKTTGYARSELLGKNPRVWGGQMPKEFYETMWKTISEDRKPFISEVTNKRKTGEQYIALISISPVFDSSGHEIFYIGLERDITKEKEIDRAKTEFVSLASHQLRTPLSAVNWYTEMLLDGDAGELTEKQKSYLDEVVVGNRRMVELVEALLNVSRLELGTFIVEPQPVNVLEMAKSVLGELKPQILQNKITLKEEYGDALPEFSADPKLLRMVFQNLLSNAVKYTPEGGTVSLDVRTAESGTFGDKELTVPSLTISVSDTGYGIPKEQQDKIFSKLFRADNARAKVTEGTGLGLYIVKAITDNTGGAIWFESDENKGTKFYVTFPLSGMLPKEGTKPLE